MEINQRDMLSDMGFGTAFTSSVMDCVESPNFSILIEGQLLKLFHSERGIRQGILSLTPLFIRDPLFNAVERARQINPYVIGGVLSITHLIFIDDLMCFT